MKTLLFVVCGLVLCGAGCSRDPVAELPDLSVPRRAGPGVDEAEIREQLTNDVVGLNRIISIYVDRRAPEPTNWTAEVTVEYVNHEGGIDRTNLPYKCYQPHVWYEDTKKLFKRDLAEHQ